MLGAKGRDLDDFAAKNDVRKTKAPADEAAVLEQPPHVLGVCVGGHVEVLGLASEQQVAYAATDQIRRITGILQPVEDFKCVVADLGTRDGVFRSGYDDRTANDPSWATGLPVSKSLLVE